MIRRNYYELPSTGGRGINLILFFGVQFMALGAAVYHRNSAGRRD